MRRTHVRGAAERVRDGVDGGCVRAYSACAADRCNRPTVGVHLSLMNSSSTVTRQIPDADLQIFSERLLHSIQLYFALSRRLARIRLGFEEAPSWETETAMVESFALHTRGLADFFFTKKASDNERRRHDAWALHYFSPNDRWPRIVGDPGRWLAQTYQRALRGQAGVDRFGALVAHLNYREAPTSELTRGWPVMQLSHDVGIAVALRGTRRRREGRGRLPRGRVARDPCRCSPQHTSLAVSDLDSPRSETPAL